MIKNERQYRITKAQAARFNEALKQARAGGRANPSLRKLEIDALESQLGDLEREIREYESLRSSRASAVRVRSFDSFPKALVQARIAAGLSQKQLARRLGLKEQQIQRYEATEYASASLKRLQQVVAALELDVAMKIKV